MLRFHEKNYCRYAFLLSRKLRSFSGEQFQPSVVKIVKCILSVC